MHVVLEMLDTSQQINYRHSFSLREIKILVYRLS